MITTFEGQPAEVRPYHVDWDLSAAEKGGYDWFMRKEITSSRERSLTRCSAGTMRVAGSRWTKWDN